MINLEAEFYKAYQYYMFKLEALCNTKSIHMSTYKKVITNLEKDLFRLLHLQL